ncbi:ribonuclease HI [Natronocalculus amylovorans]|uniref:Ribonuclease HI family protein n=1 Tax=Natronocalculus amylovorans TaxID=2917812 RepID=A0AAE3KE89_9EURY|nr:ribonuclease HI [Natronocalculus amylovorans]MCL9818534.1 ribonuclease HI family protein [Natronocalculus amylovorans]NUE02174.1 ribonuclease HI family protein [Halorubraceae archaeon YAN]
MPTIEIDSDVAADRLRAAGITISEGNTPHEQWRAQCDHAVAVAYEGKVVVQGRSPKTLTMVLQEGGGKGYLYFDGASRGNPGPASIGWVIITGDGILAEGSRTIGTATNNQAEYEALIAGVDAATTYGLDALEIRGDSQLIIKQVRGEWQTNNPALRERRVRVRELLTQFDDWSIEHVPREINEHADKLANEALDDG